MNTLNVLEIIEQNDPDEVDISTLAQQHHQQDICSIAVISYHLLPTQHG